MEKVLKARELESEVKKSTNQKEERGGKVVLGCHAEKFLKARDLVSEVIVSGSKRKIKKGKTTRMNLGVGYIIVGRMVCWA